MIAIRTCSDAVEFTHSGSDKLIFFTSWACNGPMVGISLRIETNHMCDNLYRTANWDYFRTDTKNISDIDTNAVPSSGPVPHILKSSRIVLHINSICLYLSLFLSFYCCVNLLHVRSLSDNSRHKNHAYVLCVCAWCVCVCVVVCLMCTFARERFCTWRTRVCWCGKLPCECHRICIEIPSVKCHTSAVDPRFESACKCCVPVRAWFDLYWCCLYTTEFL